VLESLGDEASSSYTVVFPQAILSDPVVVVGGGVPAGTSVLTNTSSVANGLIGVLIATPNAYAAGVRQMIAITFNVAPGATAGTYPVSFSSSPVIQSVSSASGGSVLPVTYVPGNIVIGTTAARVEVSGRILTPDGRGLRNAVVSIVDGNCIERIATTGSFGFYRFEDVEIGRVYVIGVTSKRYRFDQRILQVFDHLADFDLVARE
jgi:hypothetical protein